MREQIQRLEGRPGTEVQSGVSTTGVTQTSAMPFVQPKQSKGERLAKSLGMAVDAGMKIGAKATELYEGQLDDEAVNQFAEDKFRFDDELNALPSDAERTLWIRNKTQELSKSGVNEKYRDAFINTYSSRYNTYSKGAVIEGYNVQTGNLYKEFIVGLPAGKSYEEITSKYHKVLPKEYYHQAYAAAILDKATSEAQSVRDMESFKDYKNTLAPLIKDYKANTFAGGSNALKAREIRNSFDTKLDAIEKDFMAKFKDNHKLFVAQSKNNPMITEESFNKKAKEALDSELITKSEYYTQTTDYAEIRKEFIATNEDVNKFNVTNDNNADLEADVFTTEAKSRITEIIKTDLQQNLAQGNLLGVIDNVKNNTKVSMPIVKSMLKTTGDAEADSNAIALYKGLKGTKNGTFILNNLDAKDRALMDITSTMKDIGVNIDYQELYKNVNSKETPLLTLADKKKFRKSFANIPQDLQDSMNSYGMALMKGGMSLSDTVEKIKEVVKTNVKDLGNWNPTVTNVKAVNFDATPFASDKEETVVNVVSEYAQEFGVDISGTNIKYDGTTDEYYIYEEGNTLMPIKILNGKEVSDFRKEWIKADKAEKIAESDAEREEALRAKKALKNSLKNPYYDGGGMFDKGGVLYDFKEQLSKDIEGANKAFIKAWSEGGKTRENFDNFINGVLDFIGPTKLGGDEVETTQEQLPNINTEEIIDILGETKVTEVAQYITEELEKDLSTEEQNALLVDFVNAIGGFGVEAPDGNAGFDEEGFARWQEEQKNKPMEAMVDTEGGSESPQYTGFDSFKQKIATIETGSQSNKFIRTKVTGSGSSAFGPYQVTKGLAESVLKNNSNIFSSSEKTALKEMVERQKISLLIGGIDRSKYEKGGKQEAKGKQLAKQYGYSSVKAFLDAFDYGGTLGYPKAKQQELKEAQEKILKLIYTKNKGSGADAAAEWHGGDSWATSDTLDGTLKYLETYKGL